MSENIFGDVFDDLPTVATAGGTRSVRTELIQEAWNLWSDITDRPKSSSPEQGFAKAYGEMLDLKYSDARLKRCVQAAAYLPPRPRDPRDTRRVIMVLNNEKMEADALSLMDSGHGEVIPWEWEEVAVQSSAHDVADSCGTHLRQWSSHEYEYAGILVQTTEPEDLERGAKLVKTYLGEVVIWPSELVKHSYIWRDGQTRVNNMRSTGRDTYQSGEKEMEHFKDIDLSLDAEASRMVLQGCPMNMVRTYHLSAPDGYWDSVASVMEENDEMDSKMAYEKLRDQFSFHPSDREKPLW